jgi:hypothetical protein
MMELKDEVDLASKPENSFDRALRYAERMLSLAERVVQPPVHPYRTEEMQQCAEQVLANRQAIFNSLVFGEPFDNGPVPRGDLKPWWEFQTWT